MTIIVLTSFTILFLALVFIAAQKHFLLAKLKEKQAEKLIPQNQCNQSPINLFNPDSKELAEIERKEQRRSLTEQRTRLLSWASLVDLGTLKEIPEIEDENLRNDVFEILVDRATNVEDLTNLVSIVLIINKFKANRKLVEAYRLIWEKTPGLQSTIDIFHLAAAANDADLLLTIFVRAAKLIETEKLNLTAHELINLAESHYWLLSAETRNSGAGFWFRQKLADARRESIKK